MGYNLLINGVYWGYNPLLTSNGTSKYVLVYMFALYNCTLPSGVGDRHVFLGPSGTLEGTQFFPQRIRGWSR